MKTYHEESIQLTTPAAGNLHGIFKTSESFFIFSFYLYPLYSSAFVISRSHIKYNTWQMVRLTIYEDKWILVKNGLIFSLPNEKSYTAFICTFRRIFLKFKARRKYWKILLERRAQSLRDLDQTNQAFSLLFHFEILVR